MVNDKQRNIKGIYICCAKERGRQVAGPWESVVTVIRVEV